MRKAPVKDLLLLCILLAGHSQLIAHTDHESALYSSIPGRTMSQADPSFTQNLPDAVIHAAKSGTEKKKNKREISVFECEEEKDERVSFTRYSSGSQSFITLHYAQVPDFTFNSVEQRSPFYGDLQFVVHNYQPHLLFQVFRI